MDTVGVVKATPREMRHVWGLMVVSCLVFWAVVIGGIALVLS